MKGKTKETDDHVFIMRVNEKNMNLDKLMLKWVVRGNMYTLGRELPSSYGYQAWNTRHNTALETFDGTK